MSFQGDMFGGPSIPCRTALVPVSQGRKPLAAPIDALEVFQLPFRDTLDFTVDFSLWMSGNGVPCLDAAVFTVAQGSPQTPEMSGEAFIPQGKACIVLAVPPSGKPGDAYWLDVKASFAASPPEPGCLSLSARSITRRIQVVVVEG